MTGIDRTVDLNAPTPFDRTAPGQVRVADSGMAGRGATIFRGDRKIAARLVAWLEERPAAR